MPKEIEAHLAAKYLPQIEQLSRTIGGYATQWLQDAQRRLVGANVYES